VPIKMTAGVTVRTATFWFPADYLGITDWPTTFADVLDRYLTPTPRLIAAVPADRTQLAAPTGDGPIRCAGGPLRLLDLAASSAIAGRDADRRYHQWSATGAIGARRRFPRGTELALLRAGRDTYQTYHRLRQVVGDALLDRGTDTVLGPADATPAGLLAYLHDATAHLATACADDVLVTVTA
jgi:hypothetical protein